MASVPPVPSAAVLEFEIVEVKYPILAVTTHVEVRTVGGNPADESRRRGSVDADAWHVALEGADQRACRVPDGGQWRSLSRLSAWLGSQSEQDLLLLGGREAV